MIVSRGSCSRGNVNFVINDNCMKYHRDWVVVVCDTVPQSPLISRFYIPQYTIFNRNMHISVTNRCIVEYWAGASRDLWDGFIHERLSKIIDIHIKRAWQPTAPARHIQVSGIWYTPRANLVFFVYIPMYVCVSMLFWRRILTAFLLNLMASLFA